MSKVKVYRVRSWKGLLELIVETVKLEGVAPHVQNFERVKKERTIKGVLNVRN